jgi:hemerythrin-like domain-containing protein
MAKARKRATVKKKSKGSTRKTARPAAGRRGAPAKRAKAKRAPAKGAKKSTASGSRKTAGAASRLSTTAQAVGRALGRTAAAVVEHTPWGTSQPNAIELLEADHRRMEDLLKQGEETTARSVKGRTELLNTITTELNVHELIEEKILYPALKSHPEAKDIVLEGYQEHHVADLIVKELHGLARSDERWGAKFSVLKENIEHHIEEEEGEMFKKARSIFSDEQLDALGARMAAMKADALKKA